VQTGLPYQQHVANAGRSHRIKSVSVRRERLDVTDMGRQSFILLGFGILAIEVTIAVSQFDGTVPARSNWGK
jgi:hypothetical protein